MYCMIAQVKDRLKSLLLQADLKSFVEHEIKKIIHISQELLEVPWHYY